jgi:Arc/MetJ family transcription regulator
MRITIEIDDQLMKRAMNAAGTTMKQKTVRKALELLVRIQGQQEIRKLRGKVQWQGNIDAWRRD